MDDVVNLVQRAPLRLAAAFVASVAFYGGPYFIDRYKVKVDHVPIPSSTSAAQTQSSLVSSTVQVPSSVQVSTVIQASPTFQHSSLLIETNINWFASHFDRIIDMISAYITMCLVWLGVLCSSTYNSCKHFLPALQSLSDAVSYVNNAMSTRVVVYILVFTVVGLAGVFAARSTTNPFRQRQSVLALFGLATIFFGIGLFAAPTATELIIGLAAYALVWLFHLIIPPGSFEATWNQVLLRTFTPLRNNLVRLLRGIKQATANVIHYRIQGFPWWVTSIYILISACMSFYVVDLLWKVALSNFDGHKPFRDGRLPRISNKRLRFAWMVVDGIIRMIAISIASGFDIAADALCSLAGAGANITISTYNSSLGKMVRVYADSIVRSIVIHMFAGIHYSSGILTSLGNFLGNVTASVYNSSIAKVSGYSFANASRTLLESTLHSSHQVFSSGIDHTSGILTSLGSLVTNVTASAYNSSTAKASGYVLANVSRTLLECTVHSGHHAFSLLTWTRDFFSGIFRHSLNAQHYLLSHPRAYWCSSYDFYWCSSYNFVARIPVFAILVSIPAIILFVYSRVPELLARFELLLRAVPASFVLIYSILYLPWVDASVRCSQDVLTILALTTIACYLHRIAPNDLAVVTAHLERFASRLRRQLKRVASRSWQHLAWALIQIWRYRPLDWMYHRAALPVHQRAISPIYNLLIVPVYYTLKLVVVWIVVTVYTSAIVQSIPFQVRFFVMLGLVVGLILINADTIVTNFLFVDQLPRQFAAEHPFVLVVVLLAINAPVYAIVMLPHIAMELRAFLDAFAHDVEMEPQPQDLEGVPGNYGEMPPPPENLEEVPDNDLRMEPLPVELEVLLDNHLGMNPRSVELEDAHDNDPEMERLPVKLDDVPSGGRGHLTSAVELEEVPASDNGRCDEPSDFEGLPSGLRGRWTHPIELGELLAGHNDQPAPIDEAERLVASGRSRLLPEQSFVKTTGSSSLVEAEVESDQGSNDGDEHGFDGYLSGADQSLSGGMRDWDREEEETRKEEEKEQQQQKQQERLAREEQEKLAREEEERLALEEQERKKKEAEEAERKAAEVKKAEEERQKREAEAKATQGTTTSNVNRKKRSLSPSAPSSPSRNGGKRHCQLPSPVPTPSFAPVPLEPAVAAGADLIGVEPQDINMGEAGGDEEELSVSTSVVLGGASGDNEPDISGNIVMSDPPDVDEDGEYEEESDIEMEDSPPAPLAPAMLAPDSSLGANFAARDASSFFRAPRLNLNVGQASSPVQPSFSSPLPTLQPMRAFAPTPASTSGSTARDMSSFFRPPSLNLNLGQANSPHQLSLSSPTPAPRSMRAFALNTTPAVSSTGRDVSSFFRPPNLNLNLGQTHSPNQLSFSSPLSAQQPMRTFAPATTPAFGSTGRDMSSFFRAPSLNHNLR